MSTLGHSSYSTKTVDSIQSIDALIRRAAQHHADAGRDLSGRSSFLFNPLELRSGPLFQNLNFIAEAAQKVDLEEIPSEQKRKIRESIQFVYQYLFGSRYNSPHSSNVFVIDQSFQVEPIGQLLNAVRVRLSPPDELLSIGRASERMGIGRSQGYEWTHSGIFHPVSVSKGTADNLQRIELWEVLLIARDRGIILSMRSMGQEE